MTLWSVSEAVGLGCSHAYRGMGGLDQRHWFLTLLKAGKSKIMMSADLALDENPLCGLQTDTFPLCPHSEECPHRGRREGWRGEGEREDPGLSSSSYKGSIPFLAACLLAQPVKNLPAIQEIPGWGRSLKKGTAAHSSILA